MTVLELVGDATGLEFLDDKGKRLGLLPAGSVRHAVLHDGACVVDDVILVGTSGGMELHLHGGDALFARVIGLLERCGFEPAQATREPGAALSLRHARALLSNRHGPLARLVASLAKRRGSEGLPDDVAADVARALRLSKFAGRLRRPPVVRIVGRPNAGKSTLFNAWVGREQALVSPHAGTTRDTVRATVLLRGVPIELEDSAGGEPRRTSAGDADLLVHLLSAADETGSLSVVHENVIEVFGRADEVPAPATHRRVSGLTGIGLAALLEDVADALNLATDRADDAWAPVDAIHARDLEASARSLPKPM